MATRAPRRVYPAKPGTPAAARPRAAVARRQPPVFVSTYGEPNAEKVLSSFEQYCELAYGGNAAIFGLLNMQMRLFSEARLGWLDEEKDLEFTPGLEKLETPWPNGTTGELLARMRQDAAIAGNAYIRDCGYRLERLRPDWVTIISQVTTDDFGHEVREVIGYWYEPVGDTDREPAYYPVQEVAHWAPIPDPIANWRGMSWFTPALREINADRAMTEHREKFFRNAASPNIIIKYTGKITPSQKVGLVESISAKHGGPDKAGGTLVLDEGADPMIVGSKFSDAEFSEVLAATENRMAVAAGVPALLVGLKEGLDAAAWSMYKQAIRAFADLFVRSDWRSACASLAVLVAASRPEGKRLWFDTSDIAALADGEAETASRMQTEAATIASLIQAGFEPDSAVKAVKAGDITLLKHTGLVSVQLLPPGQQDQPEPKTEADKPAEDEPVARALIAELSRSRASHDETMAWARDLIERRWSPDTFDESKVRRDGVGQFASTGGGLLDGGSSWAARIASGIASELTLSDPENASHVDLVRFNDGSLAVVKIPKADEEMGIGELDAEELGAHVARVLGLSPPEVHRSDDFQAFFSYVQATEPDAVLGVDVDLGVALATADAKRIGLLDVLTENTDRNTGNWFATPGGRLIPIDHGQAWVAARVGRDGPLTAPWPSDFGTSFSVKVGPGVQPGQWVYNPDAFAADWIDNDLSPAYVRSLRPKLEALRPEFERLGRSEWLDRVLIRLDIIASHAKGTVTL